MKYSRFFRLLLTTMQIMALLLIQLPSNTTVKAITGYTVTYNGNGHSDGNVPLDTNLYAEGDEISIAGNTGSLERNGLVFVGWTKVADGTDVLKPGDKIIMETSDIILYAKWEPALIVNYDFDNQLTDQLGNSVLIPFSTENDGYSHNNATSGFGNDDDGSYWYWTSSLSRGGGFKIDIDQDISTSYTIGVRFSFTSTGSGYRKIIDYKNSASDTGFYFLGGRLNFYPYGTGTTTVANNQVVDIIATRKSDGLFTAYFVINGTLYKELELNSGSEAIPSIVDGKVRFGFFFDDNATSSEATSGGKVYSVRVWNGPISSVQAETAMEPTYTVSFDTDSDITIATQTVKENEKAAQPADPTKIGHDFLGWYYPVSQGWMEYDFDTPVTENIELKALWQIKQYTVKFLDHDETLILETLVDHGADAIAPSDPSREGWQFNGWDTGYTNIISTRIIRATYKSAIHTEIEDDASENLNVESPDLDQAVTFNEEELEELVRIRLKVSLLTPQEMTPAESDLFDEYLETLGSDLTYTSFLLDISLFKEVGDEVFAIGQSAQPITITFNVPQAYQGKDFKLIRIHQGLIEELIYQFDTDTNKITFSSDKFSTYGLVLGEQAPLPDTRDKHSFGWMMLWFGLILLLISSKKAIKE